MSSASPARPDTQNGRRSNSFVGGLIKRSKSSDLLGDRKISSSIARVPEGEDQNKAPKVPPTLPSVVPQPQLQTFGGESYVPKMEASEASSAVETPSPGHGRNESMTHRGRYNYANSTISSLNGPRRMRRKRDPTPYNVLVIGARNSGKTSFINFLRSSIAPHPEQQNAHNPELDFPPPSTRINPATFVQHYQEIDIEDEKVGISIWDSPGFEKSGIDFQLRELSSFVESKFEDTFIEEMKIVRSPGYKDTQIHCIFFLFEPSRLDMNINAARKAPTESIGSLRKPTRILGALDEDFELQILKSLQGKTTVIPVISKADTATTTRLAYLKKMVGESFQRAGLDPLEALHFEQSDVEDEMLDEIDEDDEDEPETPEQSVDQDERRTSSEAAQSADVDDSAATNSEGLQSNVAVEQQANTKKPLTHKREHSKRSVSSVMFDNGYMPMSILSPDEYALDGNDGPVGRRYAWGFADPYNPEHSDFVKLKETCFTEWRVDFREASREVFYERWRTDRLNRGPAAPANGAKKSPAPMSPARKASGGIPIELTRKTKYT